MPKIPRQPIEKASATEPSRQDLLQRINALHTVFDLSNLFAGSNDLGDILNAAARHAADVMGVRACGIRLLDESTGELVIRATYNLSDAYLNKGPVLVDENPIDAAAMSGESVYIAEAWTDPRVRYPTQAKAEGLVSGLCVPMTYRGQTVGVIRVYSGQPRQFSQEEDAVLRLVGSQAAAGIINARLLKEQRQAERYQRQIRYAGEIQRRMIPDHPPQHDFVTFGCVYEASLDVGGDFYDFIELPDGSAGLAIADVVGKGIPAALMMASVRSALRAYVAHIEGIGRVMSQVNRHLCRDTLTSEFATMFYGVFSADRRKLIYVNAGHDPPLLLRADRFTRLDTGGTLIGVMPDATFEEGCIELEHGDLIVFYTDGVVDAMDFEGHRFGRKRLESSILKYRDADAETIAQQIKWDTRRFAGLAPQTDDMTIVVAKIH